MLPADMKNTIARKKLRFYNVNAIKIASDIGLGGRINMVMMAAFFKLSEVIPYDEAEKYMKQAVKKSYGKKGDAIVNMNYAAIVNAISGIEQINYPESWADTKEGADQIHVPATKYFDTVVHPFWLRRETACLFPPLIPPDMCLQVLPSTRSAALPLISPNGFLKTAYSATSALWSAPMPA